MNIFVKVKSKARLEKVEKIDSAHFIVHTKEAPEKGRANKGVISLLSHHFSIPQSRIKIISGQKAHLKIIALQT